MKNQKGFAPVLIILLLGLLAVGGFYIYQISKGSSLPQLTNVSKKAESQDYSNQNLGLSFKYSNDLSVKQDSEEEFNKRGNGDFRKNFRGYVGYEPGKFLAGAAVLEKSGSYDTNPFTVWVFNNDNNLTIEQWYQQYWYYPFVWGDFTYTGKFELAPKEDATISGQMGKSGIIDYQPGKPKFVYIFNNDGKMYLFRIIGASGDQILSTFKFLNNLKSDEKYPCPKSGWDNCMPMLTPEAKKQCTREAFEWKKANCPNYKGGAQ